MSMTLAWIGWDLGPRLLNKGRVDAWRLTPFSFLSLARSGGCSAHGVHWAPDPTCLNFFLALARLVGSWLTRRVSPTLGRALPVVVRGALRLHTAWSWTAPLLCSEISAETHSLEH